MKITYISKWIKRERREDVDWRFKFKELRAKVSVVLVLLSARIVFCFRTFLLSFSMFSSHPLRNKRFFLISFRHKGPQKKSDLSVLSSIVSLHNICGNVCFTTKLSTKHYNDPNSDTIFINFVLLNFVFVADQVHYRCTR
jgi:hypothetical protein